MEWSSGKRVESERQMELEKEEGFIDSGSKEKRLKSGGKQVIEDRKRRTVKRKKNEKTEVGTRKQAIEHGKQKTEKRT